MSHTTVTTVTGAISPDALGKTLMHEHLLIAYPGWQADTVSPGPAADERFARCVDRIEEIQALGYESLLDP
jgi:phosphotriesterase-related protein